jgi:hypothetical protein
LIGRLQTALVPANSWTWVAVSIDGIIPASQISAAVRASLASSDRSW